MKICTIVGARPQFIKASAVSRVIDATDEIEEILVHTGQHYDANMSDVFFEELKLRRPNYNLDIGGGSLELTSGPDENPDKAFSLPLGAGRLTPASPARRSTARGWVSSRAPARLMPSPLQAKGDFPPSPSWPRWSGSSPRSPSSPTSTARRHRCCRWGSSGRAPSRPSPS